MLTPAFIEHFKLLEKTLNLYKPLSFQKNKSTIAESQNECLLSQKKILNLEYIKQVLGPDFDLDFLDNRLILKKHGSDTSQTELSSKNHLCVDFLDKNFQNRIQKLNNEYLPKVFSYKRNNRFVFDGTAGFGKDIVISLACGFNIVACEENPVVYLLLQDGFRRLFEQKEYSGWAKNIQLFCADSCVFLDFYSEQKFDVIYLDPLFSNKTSMSNKYMEVLKRICEKKDPQVLFEKSFDCVKDRVVLKQHLKSNYLSGKKPSFVKKGKSFRFDVYQIS